ncbi:MAG: hypothetical protein NZ518_05390, partial [Dehalococcoidia bacterium]|nr:hypothetical protein [Dehalococcoidia bacterium]
RSECQHATGERQGHEGSVLDPVGPENPLQSDAMSAPTTEPLTTYYYQTLTVGDPTNCVGICTLWTPQEKIARRLSPSEYGRIGNLYSRDGINHIIRNVLADPVVRYIIICGVDLTGSGEAFLRFARNGVDADHRIVGDPGRIDPELPIEALEEFRRHVQLIDLRGATDPETLRAVLRTLPPLPPFAEPRVFPKSAPSATTFPGEGAGRVARGKRVADTWLRALGEVMRFGEEVVGPFGDRQKDIADLVAVVSDERPADPYLPEWMPITAAYLEEVAYPLLLSARPPDGLTDTEGQRLFAYDGVDQVERMVAALRQSAASHHAVATLWRPDGDHGRPTAPSLLALQSRVRSDQLFLTATYRSIDVFRSWPETAFALRQLQQRLADSIGVAMGSLTTVAHAATIQASDWELAVDVIEQHRRRVARRPRKEDRDPRGSFVIRLEGGEIVVTHYSREGIRLQEFHGTNAADLALAMQPYFSQIDHALHIGGELAKAEVALRTPGARYVQDHPLELDRRIASAR